MPSPDKFLRNIWYAAARAEEVGRALFHRTLLGQSVLLYRREDGEAVALENICPHRFAPLDRGQLVGDAVECGYHGLVFGPDGKCLRNPHGDGRIAPSSHVRSFALVERHRFLWIWLGDRPADPALLPDFAYLENGPHAVTVLDYLTVQANYLLIVDNLLDNSHADYLHKGSFAATAGAETPTLEVVGDERTVRAIRLVRNSEMPNAFRHALAWAGRVDKWQDVRWWPPGNICLDVGVAPAGQPRAAGAKVDATHILTPETASSTHYFIGSTRHHDIENKELDKRVIAIMRGPTESDDKPMIEAQQANIGDREFWSLKPVLLESDLAAVRARRIMDRLIAEEREPAKA